MKKIFIILPLFFILSVNADEKASDKEGPTASAESIIVNKAELKEMVDYNINEQKRMKLDDKKSLLKMSGSALFIWGITAIMIQPFIAEPSVIVGSFGAATGITGCYLSFRSK